MGSEPHIIVIDNSQNALPPYEQIRSQVASMIVAGHLSSGHVLPTIRDLARDLRLAPGTITRAYKELEAEGLVVMAGRRGTMVADTIPANIRVPEEIDQKARDIIEVAKELDFPIERLAAHLRLLARQT